MFYSEYKRIYTKIIANHKFLRKSYSFYFIFKVSVICFEEIKTFDFQNLVAQVLEKTL